MADDRGSVRFEPGIDRPDRVEIKNEVGCPRGRAMFAGPNHWCDWRSLVPSDPARMLPAHTAIRGISVSAWNYAPSACGEIKEAGPARGLAPRDDGACALGRYAHGRRTRA